MKWYKVIIGNVVGLVLLLVLLPVLFLIVALIMLFHWAIAIVAVLLLIVLFELIMRLLDRNSQLVCINAGVEDLREFVWRYFRVGRNERPVIYHRASDTLIQMVRRASPCVPTGKLGWHVIKTRVPHAPDFNADSRWVLPIRRTPYSYVGVSRWRLPSPCEGKELLDIDCGWSSAKVDEAVDRIVSEDADIPENTHFYVWCEKDQPGPRKI